MVTTSAMVTAASVSARCCAQSEYASEHTLIPIAATRIARRAYINLEIPPGRGLSLGTGGGGAIVPGPPRVAAGSATAPRNIGLAHLGQTAHSSWTLEPHLTQNSDVPKFRAGMGCRAKLPTFARFAPRTAFATIQPQIRKMKMNKMNIMSSTLLPHHRAPRSVIRSGVVAMAIALRIIMNCPFL